MVNRRAHLFLFIVCFGFSSLLLFQIPLHLFIFFRQSLSFWRHRAVCDNRFHFRICPLFFPNIRAIAKKEFVSASFQNNERRDCEAIHKQVCVKVDHLINGEDMTLPILHLFDSVMPMTQDETNIIMPAILSQPRFLCFAFINEIQ